MAQSIKNAEMKRKAKQLVKELNGLGFTGGLYYYKSGECSCCYGLEEKFFEINGNIPSNWGVYGSKNLYFKISYKYNDARSDEFRNAANQLAVKIFGSAVELAKDTSQCVIINFEDTE